MKKVFLSTTVILLGMIYMFTIAGCQKLEDLLPNHHQGQPTPVTMNFITYTTQQGTGTFTSHGGLEASGTYTMVVEKINATAIHCTTTCVTQQGTFVILSDCQLDTMLGHWTISDGTGAYHQLRGNGTLVMMVTPEGKRQESLSGNVY